MRKEKGSIYSLDTINNGPSCKNGKKPYLKCTMTSLSTMTCHSYSSYVSCIAPLLLALKKHLEPSSSSVQLHKNHSIWFRNEEHIKNCSIINTCLMISDSTLHAKFWLLGNIQIHLGTHTHASNHVPH
jgi:hypothetical protein